MTITRRPRRKNCSWIQLVQCVICVAWSRSRPLPNRSPHVQPRPKALGALREQRLAAKQELKAVRNILDHANFDLDTIFSATPLRAIDPAHETRAEHRLGSDVLAFHVNTTTGECTWAAVMPGEDTTVRLVLAPDEGGPLFACYQYLALQGAKVTLNRDALLLG